MRFTRAQVVNAIIEQCGTVLGIQVSEVKHIEETPQRLRHACAYSPNLIEYLDMIPFSVPDEMIPDLNLPFYVCPHCGKLYVYKYLYE